MLELFINASLAIFFFTWGIINLYLLLVVAILMIDGTYMTLILLQKDRKRKKRLRIIK